MTLARNLLILREKKFASAAELARQVGVTKQSIYQYEKGQSVPGKEILSRLAQAFGVSVADLYGDVNPEKLTSVPDPGSSTKVRIPFYDAVAVGGAGILADQTAVNGPNDMIDPGTFLRRATGSLRIYGHSMFPKYPAGCIVAFREADKELIIWGEDYVIELEDRRIIKRVEKGETTGMIRAVSYNRSEEYIYAPIDVPVAKIKRLYMVLGKIELEASI